MEEFGAFGDEPDPRIQRRVLEEGLEVLAALLSGGPVDHDGVRYAVREVRFRPTPAVPSWSAGRFGNQAPVRRAPDVMGSSSSGWTSPILNEVTACLAERPRRPASRWWSTYGSSTIPRGDWTAARPLC